MFRKIACLLLAVLMILSLIGCSGKKVKQFYDANSPINKQSSGLIAANSNYELLWNDTACSVELKSLKNGKVWSTVPSGYSGTSSAVRSTININIMDTTSMKQDMVRGYTGTASNNRIASQKIENGIRITYYFDNYMISVPVEYTLRNDSLKATIKTAEVVEGGNYIVVSVELAPYLCSAENTAENGQLFVPTGSGAVMNVQSDADSTRKYTGIVYGDDASRILPEIPIENEKIYMPVFGATSGQNALLGIIEGASETAAINAEAGNSRTDWSCIYPTFYLRGYDSFPTTEWIWSYQDLNYMSEDVIDTVITVGYYPLYDGDANYNGMAKCYRDYLNKNKQLKKSSVTAKPYALSIIGGALKTVATGGIPHKVTSVTTTFSGAKNIVEDASKTIGSKPSVQMLGYGNNGLDIGKIAGGYKFNSDFGGKKAKKALEDYCKKNKIDIYTDFDVVRFNKSGGGFNATFSAAKSATLRVAESSLINTPLRDFNTDTTYRFLKKSDISKAVNKLTKKANKLNVSGISLSSLSSVAYSDFRENEYGVKGKMSQITQNAISTIKKSGHAVAVSDANAYAAASADVIYNAPLTNGNYDVFDMWVPFYQMVFAGSKPIYSSYINLEDNSELAILRALASGSGLGFAVTDKYDIDLSVSNTFALYGTVYKDNKQLINDSVKTYKDYYEKIKGANIVSYTMLENGVSLTEFNNGVKIYVNYSDNVVNTAVGDIGPLSAKWIKD